MIKIAIIDDHDLFREGIKLVLSQIDGFEVVYDTSDGFEFIEFLQHSLPDVVLMDINMPVLDGVEATKKAIEVQPTLKVIALTMFSDTTHYTQMINAGVKGFLLKKSNKNELQLAITLVDSGGNYFSQEIMQKLAFNVVKANSGQESLTAREFDVLHLVCSGLTTQEIADRLFISAKTVEVHRNNIFHKADVRNTVELILWAIKNDYFNIG